MSKPNFKVQAIREGFQWPYIGNAYRNKDGSIGLLLDRDVTLTLADGTKLRAVDNRLVKLHLRAPKG